MTGTSSYTQQTKEKKFTNSYDSFASYLDSAYGNLSAPDFDFAKRGFDKRPYDRIIKRLRDYAAIEEILVGEEDVCFSYFLKGRTNLWKIELSLVGPFAIFVRLKAQVTADDFLHNRKEDLIEFERKVVEIVRNFGISLLTTNQLQISVPLTLFNTPKENVRLYQALFTDRDGLPWE